MAQQARVGIRQRGCSTPRDWRGDCLARPSAELQDERRRISRTPLSLLIATADDARTADSLAASAPTSSPARAAMRRRSESRASHPAWKAARAASNAGEGVAAWAGSMTASIVKAGRDLIGNQGRTWPDDAEGCGENIDGGPALGPSQLMGVPRNGDPDGHIRRRAGVTIRRPGQWRRLSEQHLRQVIHWIEESSSVELPPRIGPDVNRYYSGRDHHGSRAGAALIEQLPACSKKGNHRSVRTVWAGAIRVRAPPVTRREICSAAAGHRRTCFRRVQSDGKVVTRQDNGICLVALDRD